MKPCTNIQFLLIPIIELKIKNFIFVVIGSVKFPTLVKGHPLLLPVCLTAEVKALLLVSLVLPLEQDWHLKTLKPQVRTQQLGLPIESVLLKAANHTTEHLLLCSTTKDM